MRKSLEAFAACAVLLLAFIVPGLAQADVVDRVVAKVNEEIITLSQVRERAELMLGRLKMNGVTEVPSDQDLLKRSMEEIIDERLQLQDGKKNKIDVDNQSVLKALEDIKKRNNLTQEQLETMLAQEGRSMDQYQGTIREQILLSKVVRFQMGDPGKVSEKAVQAYYREHLADYWVPPTPHVSHILFIIDELMDESEAEGKRQAARDVMAKIRAGEDFEDLAREYSEDVSGRNGGKIGPVALGNLVPEFEKVAFSLKEGEISDLVETKYGLHIIRVDKREEGHTQPLEEVKAAIADKLGSKARANAYNSWMDELRAKAFIETFLFDEKGDEKVEDIAEEPPPAPVTVKAPATRGEDLETVEAQLSRIKDLYAKKQISESEYNKRKQALLDRL